MRLVALGCAVALTFGLARSAHAEVVSSGATGFQLKFVVSSSLAPKAAYDRFITVGQWWSDSHTYSGKASALSIAPRAGGCWCERLPTGGSVQHAVVDLVMPGKMLRFQGGIGPLGAMGVSATLTVTFTAKGMGTEVTATYNVSGYSPDGFIALAKVVDGVVGEQFQRYAAPK